VLAWLARLGEGASGQCADWLLQHQQHGARPAAPAGGNPARGNPAGGNPAAAAAASPVDSWRRRGPDSAAGAALAASATAGADAVLVFLPGIKEITTVQELLLGAPEFSREPSRSWVLPLHSTVPPEDQRRVFMRPPPGVRKIVLATNIAETAITIDDIGFVVDTGRMKENRYDPLKARRRRTPLLGTLRIALHSYRFRRCVRTSCERHV
jgi:hypothetical protein